MPLKISYELAFPKTCNICGGKVDLIRTTKYKSGYMYSCNECHAQVGTFELNPDMAMGLLADSETRKKRLEVHRLFDRFWRTNSGRKIEYQKLAKALGISEDECHFALMDMEMLKKAEKYLIQKWREKYDI